MSLQNASALWKITEAGKSRAAERMDGRNWHNWGIAQHNWKLLQGKRRSSQVGQISLFNAMLTSIAWTKVYKLAPEHMAGKRFSQKPFDVFFTYNRKAGNTLSRATQIWAQH
jgi:hypothetical protein